MGKRKGIDPWFYDKVVSFTRQFHEYIERGPEQLDHRLQRALRQNPKLIEGKLLAGLEFQLRNESQPDTKNDEITRLAHKADQRALAEAKPFLLGPATLESLIQRVPETYDYISKGKLPFDSLFFEFSEAFSFGLPFSSEKAEIRGIQLYPCTYYEGLLPMLFSEKSKPDEYVIKIYYQDSYNKINILEMKCNPERKSRFKGSLYTTTDYVAFEVDMDSKVVRYSTTADERAWLLQAKTLSIKPRFFHREHISLVKNNEGLTQIANLCTNIINYINAHNIEKIKRERDVEVIQDTGKRGRVRRKKQPFYLVVVRDGTYEEPEEPTGQTWNLNWRVYVRGHDRRYRNDRGQIYLISWIAPFIKGPPDAPWKHNRYVVLAEKLEREKALLRQYL